jgi:glycosyltransferase involved in cell wall biosynthesis
MKFCFLIDSYHPITDGVVTYLDYVVPALIDLGHEVSLVVPWFGGTEHYEYPYEGCTVIRCFNTRIYTEGYWLALPDWRLFKAVKQADFVVVHSIMFLGGLGGILARLLNKKIGLFVHQDERVILRNVLGTPEPLWNLTITALSKIIYSWVIDVFFHATERFKQKLLELGVSEEKVFHTPFAINQERFHPDEGDYDIRARHGIPKDAVVSVYVGRLAKEKNVNNLLEGVDRALEEEPNLWGLFVGGGPDWDYYANYPYKNKDRMVFTGFVSDEELHSHYVAGDFFSNPSLNESSCFTVFEAMSCQIPVMTSEYKHDPDIIHKENAILVENIFDPDEIKKYVLLLARDEQLREKLGRNGKKLVEERTWRHHALCFLKGVNYAIKKDQGCRFLNIFKHKYQYQQLKKRNRKRRKNK